MYRHEQLFTRNGKHSLALHCFGLNLESFSPVYLRQHFRTGHRSHLHRLQSCHTVAREIERGLDVFTTGGGGALSLLA